MGRVLGAKAGIPGHDCSLMSPHLASLKVRFMMQIWSNVLAGVICSTRSNFAVSSFLLLRGSLLMSLLEAFPWLLSKGLSPWWAICPPFLDRGGLGAS